MNSPTISPALLTKDLRYCYPDGTVGLANASFSLVPGEVVALLGANGSGKTTLLLSLVGLLDAAGSVEIFGIRLEKKSLSEIRKRVGFLFQRPDDQLFCQTVLDDALFGPLNLGHSIEEATRAAKESLRLVGLEGYENRSSYRLSFGEKKRAALASVLAMNPDILLLDEPTGGLDPKSAAAVVDIIGEIRRQRKTVLAATHDLHFAAEATDRAIVLGTDKSVVADRATLEILSNHDLLASNNLVHVHRHLHAGAMDRHVHAHDHWRHGH